VRCSQDFTDPHPLQALAEHVTVDGRPRRTAKGI
jgi:hypothetical protein